MKGKAEGSQGQEGRAGKGRICRKQSFIGPGLVAWLLNSVTFISKEIKVLKTESLSLDLYLSGLS